jgi:Putative peptidoglycan binding domain
MVARALMTARRAAVVAAAIAACAVPAVVSPAAAGAETIGPSTPSASPFDGDGMWIWYVSRSGGSAAAIAQQAQSYGIEYVLIKSGDGGSAWSQFTPDLVAQLHAAGIKVCGWQFVYGRDPVAEASVGAGTALRGADCLVIDAESDYEGKYRSADRYIRSLRAQVGANYPVGLAGFPYVDYHPSFPYSVFLGAGGAQFNLPQMYWHTIGTSVADAYKHTFDLNQLYKKPIYPLGQTYANPPLSEISQFRSYGQLYGATGVSWWSWQETSTPEWQTLAAPLAAASGGSPPVRSYPRLRGGSRGDLVILVQQLLRGNGRKVPVTGVLDRKTAAALRKFQRKRKLVANGKVNAATWVKLLARNPKPTRWSARAAGASASSAGGGHEPRSASLRAKGYEIPPSGGAG